MLEQKEGSIMKVQLFSTNHGMKSRSLKRLAVALSAALGYTVYRTTTPRNDRIQLRYGHQVNKLSQYKWFKQKNISSFEFTTVRAEAQAWVTEGFTVFGRETLNGQGGAGIRIFSTDNPADSAVVSPCEVYTKYKPKKREFRVHICGDKVVAIVEKKKRHDHQGPSDSRVRNLANGFVFCQETTLTPALKAKIEATSLAASKVCSQSFFRGVDVGYNQAKDDVFVIEVNSAPGIEGTNVESYKNAIIASLQ